MYNGGIIVQVRNAISIIRLLFAKLHIVFIYYPIILYCVKNVIGGYQQSDSHFLCRWMYYKLHAIFHSNTIFRASCYCFSRHVHWHITKYTLVVYWQFVWQLLRFYNLKRKYSKPIHNYLWLQQHCVCCKLNYYDIWIKVHA